MAETITRYGPPNSMDKFPRGTFIKQILSACAEVYWEQMSNDSENPIWEKL